MRRCRDTLPTKDSLLAAPYCDKTYARWGVSQYIVYTSNIFAILGLRALFFLLAGVLSRFHYLKVGLSLVLAFVGVKMLVSDVYKIPISISLAVVAALIGGAVAGSLLWPRPEPLPVHEHGGTPPAFPFTESEP